MFKKSDDDWNPRVVFDGYLWKTCLPEICGPSIDSDYHIRVVRRATSSGTRRFWDLVVEREGIQDAIGRPTWLPVTGDDRFKVLAMVGVLLHTLEREEPPPPQDDELINPDEPKT